MAATGSSTSPRTFVAIPVCNEAETIIPCLQALAGQRDSRIDHTVLLINNTTDLTAGIVRRLAPTLPFPVSLVERTYPPAQAHAGSARRDALELAAAFALDHDLLLTTDADGEVEPDWLTNTLRAFQRHDVGAVFGRATLHPRDAHLIPAHLHRDDAEEIAYITALDHLATLIDPVPHDPWPRHVEHSGASIAVRRAVWEQVGGLPACPVGEDRAFYRALLRRDIPIRHAPDVRVRVSGRLIGRAQGGMANTMARRIIQQDAELDETAETPAEHLHRIRLRQSFHRLRKSPSSAAVTHMARRARLPVEHILAALNAPWFGAAWEQIETTSPLLQTSPLLRKDIARHHCRLAQLLTRLQQAAPTGHGVDSSSFPAPRQPGASAAVTC